MVWTPLRMACALILGLGPLSLMLTDADEQQSSAAKQSVNQEMPEKVPLTGKVLGPDGEPLDNALISVTSVQQPYGGTLEAHMAKLKELRKPEFRFSSYPAELLEQSANPLLREGVTKETRTNTMGEFAIEGVPEGFLVWLEVMHRNVKTTKLTVAARAIESIRTEPNKSHPQGRAILLGSGFVEQLPKGYTIRGRVIQKEGYAKGKPKAGVIVAMANHNAARGISGREILTDAEGRFEITGLGPDYYEPGYDIAAIGTYETPIEPVRVTVFPDYDNEIVAQPAVRYKLKLTDPEGNPIDRKVYSIHVQARMHQSENNASRLFHLAERIAPGIYRGIVPSGPAAVIVNREDKHDRPVAIDAKAFFAPGRKDWTEEEQRYAYGNEWSLVRPAVRIFNGYGNAEYSQLEMAAVVLTNARKGSLELEATVTQDLPTTIRLIDEQGKPVEGAQLTRQLKRYNQRSVSSFVPIYGLHPKRAELIQFYHEERDLVGVIQATTSPEKPLTVVMKPSAWIQGRFVNAEGEPSDEYGARWEGPVPPYSHLGNYRRSTPRVPKGTFGRRLVPGETYSGLLIRKTGTQWKPRPSIGPAFGPITPQPGEVIDLGEILVPE